MAGGRAYPDVFIDVISQAKCYREQFVFFAWSGTTWCGRPVLFCRGPPCEEMCTLWEGVDRDLQQWVRREEKRERTAGCMRLCGKQAQHRAPQGGHQPLTMYRIDSAGYVVHICYPDMLGHVAGGKNTWLSYCGRLCTRNNIERVFKAYPHTLHFVGFLGRAPALLRVSYSSSTKTKTGHTTMMLLLHTVVYLRAACVCTRAPRVYGCCPISACHYEVTTAHE